MDICKAKVNGVIFPARSACVFDTHGERRFAERLDKSLDDYLCWFHRTVQSLAARLYGAASKRGLLILEVKDWQIDSIDSLDLKQVKLKVNGELVVDKNSLTQARIYALKQQSCWKRLFAAANLWSIQRQAHHALWLGSGAEQYHPEDV